MMELVKNAILNQYSDGSEVYELLFRQAPYAILIHDAETNAIVNCNQAAVALFERSMDEMIGLHQKEYVPAADLDEQGQDREFTKFASGEYGTTIKDIEVKIKTKTGSIKDVLISADLYYFHNKKYVQTIMKDITDDKLAKEILDINETRWKLALEKTGGGIWDWDVTSGIVFYSGQWKEMLGYREYEREFDNLLEGWGKRIHPEDKKQVHENLNKHFCEKTPYYQSEYRVARKDGTYKWIYDRGKVIAWSAERKPLRVVGVYTDISERKVKEKETQELAIQAQEANRAKSEFLATMSHEIRTPLNAIAGFTQLLGLSENLSDDEKDYIDKILTSTDGLLRVINSILDLSKVESGKIEIEITPHSLNDLLDDVSILKSHAMKRGISFSIWKSTTGFDNVNIDALRLKQCLVNVVSNAIKFTRDNGFVTLISSFEEQDNKNMSARFDIIDNGVGIAADKLGRIFEPFMQADSSTTRKFGGTGLGLPFTKKVIELMGGSVEVCSEENEFTIITLKIPVHIDSETFNKTIKLATTIDRIT